jgi:hypothetical protein
MVSSSSVPAEPRASGPVEPPLPLPPGAPPLTSKHLDNARLFADRNDMVASLRIPHGGAIAEVGVALGEFSTTLIKVLQPREFIAIDTFILHQIPLLWGRPTVDIFQGQTHRDFYQKVLAGSSCTLTIREGFSHTMLETFPDRYFDMIYIDADHSYEATKQDTVVATRKIRQDGVLIFNDYIMFDQFSGSPYGVVPAVNELVVNEGWRVVGLALQQQMYCDIAVRPPLMRGSVFGRG